MRVTYYALRTLQVGEDVRVPGDLIPEANVWPYLSGYVDEGKIAPVLVATLPEDAQLMLLEWEADQAAGDVEVPTDETPVTVPAPETKPPKAGKEKAA